MILKEYKESITYVTTMFIIFVSFFIYSTELIYSILYGFIFGSIIYFGFEYGYKKIIKDDK